MSIFSADSQIIPIWGKCQFAGDENCYSERFSLEKWANGNLMKFNKGMQKSCIWVRITLRISSLDTGQKAAIKHTDLKVLVSNNFNVCQLCVFSRKVTNCLLGCIGKSAISKSILSYEPGPDTT